jgi:hypothetical protein
MRSHLEGGTHPASFVRADMRDRKCQNFHCITRKRRDCAL